MQRKIGTARTLHTALVDCKSAEAQLADRHKRFEEAIRLLALIYCLLDESSGRLPRVDSAAAVPAASLVCLRRRSTCVDKVKRSNWSSSTRSHSSLKKDIGASQFSSHTTYSWWHSPFCGASADTRISEIQLSVARRRVKIKGKYRI